MRWAKTALWIGLLSGTSATALPTTGPADDVDALIAKLGEADFHVRRDASARLREVGPTALPALRQAAESDDPEVRLRASQIIRSLEQHHVPGRPRNHGRSSRITVSITNGRRVLDIDDAGRQIRIAQTDDGIVMTVQGEMDGRPVTETYKAHDADDLKLKDMEAYALYKRWSASGGLDDDLIDPFMMRGNVMLPPIAPLPPGGGRLFMIQPPVLQGGDDLVDLRLKLNDQMDRAHLTPEQRRQVTEGVDRMEEARRPGGDDDADQHIAKYNEASDALRKTLNALNLPDPGDALPPPGSARLGISAPGDAGPQGGILVSHVLAKSRAERIGLQEGDFIRGINGQPVKGVKELRRLVSEKPKGLVLDIIRDGQQMKLRENGN